MMVHDAHVAVASPDQDTVPAHVVDAVRAAVAASTAANTKKAYRSDWARFDAWCGERGVVSLPASAFTLRTS